ncbi:hypothetical protein K435DRAFT_810734 [Dendrothele bispora CBS 962.96]|uniref:Uncharacterized protein n=1 Tax=Dendrothele bispora (strain CBS 962.96) TaxID=1314807 RepID=A0A4S8KVA1_DENBC|nr:hypothetical protein K435DRAFT_810734 [Dendrothele bispora CBS 962.96]
MDSRVARILRHAFADYVPLSEVKNTLDITDGFIHGAAALAAVISDDAELPLEISIATPVTTRREWLSLFRQIPNVMSYHYWNDGSRLDIGRVERIRSYFFLPSGVSIVLQESIYNSAMPLLLCHGITSLACGIGHSSVFSLYPDLLALKLTHRIFTDDPRTELYFKGVFDESCKHGFSTVPRFGCETRWRKSYGSHGIASLPLTTSLSRFCLEKGDNLSHFRVMLAVNINFRIGSFLHEGIPYFTASPSRASDELTRK